MTYYYRARVQYDGTGYFGFQWQKDLATIQNDFNLALGKLIEGQFSTMGASRTDTGVHALEQFVKITTENEIDCSGFVTLFNQALPAQIRCLEISPIHKSFKPASDGISKEYRYLFTNTIGTNHTARRFIANNPYTINMDAMKTCAAALVGKHDFHNFVSMGSNVKTTIREITSCELSEVDPKTLFGSSEIFHLPDDVSSCYQLRIEGNGFLKQMIRHLMTAIWKVGNGRLTVEEFLNLLDGPKREKSLWKVANPKGLFLWRINYPDQEFEK
jgi:tRNA pseudouridine38-40 synthase